MKVIAAEAATTLEICDFIHGRPYSHPTGQVINFIDQSWCISPVIGNWITVNFRDLPDWLVRPAKLTVAHSWLTEGRSIAFLRSSVSPFRRIAEFLGEFGGRSMAQLRIEHSIVLERRLAKEFTRYNDTLEEESIKLGRALGLRETKKISKELRLCGPATIDSVVTRFNLAARLCEEIDGVIVPIRLRKPRATTRAESIRGIGSADPAKVLSSQQMANLERSLGRELKRYEKARNTILREVGELDFGKFKIEKGPRTFFDLERYFGINGFREHTTSEVGKLRGLAPSSHPHIPKRIERFLSRRINSDTAAGLIYLRGQLPRLRAQKRIEEANATKEYIRDVLSNADLGVGETEVTALQKYFGVDGCRMHSLWAIGKELGINERKALTQIHECLACLVGRRKAKRLLAIRRRLNFWLSRAIKAQAIRLQLCVARRISALLEIPVQPKTKIHVTEGRRIVEIQFRAGKTWGEEGLSEWIPCVDVFGEIAEDAIRVTQQLTKDLREVACEKLRERLFIVPKSSFDHVISLGPKVLHRYIYTNEKNHYTGLIRRYGLEDLFDFSFHHVRHTHSTHMVEAGGSLPDVAQYLGHTTVSGSTTMAGAFYLAGGTLEMRERTVDALRRGAATGHLFNGVARLKIEGADGGARDINIPPNQLSFQEARQRLLHADILEEIPVDPSEAAKLLEQKTIFNVTRYGGCILQANSGPCATANPCPVGILPRGVEPTAGCGCRYLVLLPHSVEQLNVDIETMEAQLREMAGEEWAMWRSHIEAKRDHYYALVETAMSLNESSKENN